MTDNTASIPTHDSSYAAKLAEFCLRGYQPPAADLAESFAQDPVWQGLAATGTEPWLDTGDLDAAAALWTREFKALTTNNTLLNKEVQKGIYDTLVPEAAAVVRAEQPGISDDLLVQEIAFVLNAVHGLKLVSRFGADVSVELHTNLSFDAEASYQYGKRFAAIHPERFIVKVPLTPEGLIAARRLADDGIRLNFTLGFSARQNHLIACFARPTWVNVFMGRLNSYVKDNGIGDGVNVGEKATLASQRNVRKLRQERGLPTHQIGASIRNGQQCFDLMGLDVFTIPTAAAAQYHEMAPTGEQLRDRTNEDPQITVNADTSIAAEGLDKLWEVEASFVSAVDSLEYRTGMTGTEIREHLRQHGVADLFPELSDADRQRIMAESKIPQRSSWHDRIAAGTASVDGLLSEAALMSFKQDQTALDDRIRATLQ